MEEQDNICAEMYSMLTEKRTSDETKQQKKTKIQQLEASPTVHNNTIFLEMDILAEAGSKIEFYKENTHSTLYT